MTEQHPLTDEICERIFQYVCHSEAERIIDQRCRASFLYPHSQRPLMTHPLTDEILESIHKDYQEAINECDTLICLKIEFDKALRAAADWQLEQVLNWLNETIIERGSSFEAINIPEELMEVMRPTQEEN